MITREQAERIAEQFVGAPADDAENGWEFVEFDAGWLLLKNATIHLRGAGAFVVERQSGRLLGFPSRVPPDLVMEQYEQVVGKAFVVDQAPPPQL